MRKGLLLLVAPLALASLVAAGEGTARTTLTIKGMTCGGCVAAVKLQLGRTGGVTAYEVSLERAEAVVTYEAARTTPDEIAAAVSKTGFEAAVKASGGTSGGQSGTAEAAANGDCAGGSCQRDCCKSARSPAASEPQKQAAGLVSLAEGLSPLASDFDAAKARPRFLAILSPTCSACVHGAEAVKEAVLPLGEGVEVFVVWTPMLDGDGAEAASRSSAILRAPRVRQYWDPTRRVGTAFRNDVFPDAVERMKRSLPSDHVLRPYFAGRDPSQPEWDIYLFFDPGVEWGAGAPLPARWVRQTMLFPAKGKEKPNSVLWTNDYASAPTEGRLADELRRQAGPGRAAVR